MNTSPLHEISNMYPVNKREITELNHYYDFKAIRDPIFELLDRMISQGWGGTPQDKIPDDWEVRNGPEYFYKRWNNKGNAA